MSQLLTLDEFDHSEVTTYTMQRHNTQRKQLVSGYCKKLTVVVLLKLIYECIRDSEWFSISPSNNGDTKNY